MGPGSHHPAHLKQALPGLGLEQLLEGRDVANQVPARPVADRQQDRDGSAPGRPQGKAVLLTRRQGRCFTA